MTRRDLLCSTALAGIARAGATLPPVYQFSGSPYAIGVAHGKALAQQIREEARPSFERLCSSWKLDKEAALRRVRSRFEGVYRELVPIAVEEIHGIAEGAKLPYDFAFYAAIRDLMPTSEGCTAVICGNGSTVTRAPIIGQTKDTSAPLTRYHLFLLSYQSGLKAVALAYPGWIGNISLTSNGMSWTGNSLYAPEPSGKLYPASLLKRLFFEKKTVREVLDATQGMRFTNGCFGVADREGTAVWMEWVEGKCDLIEASSGKSGHANTILGRSRGKDQSDTASDSSRLRQARIDQLLQQTRDPASSDRFETWFRDDVNLPRSICRVATETDPNSTTSAFISDLANLEMRVVVGSPRQGSFRRFRIGDI